MERGLDHLVYATPDLDASVEELAERFGTEPVAGGAHPGWGTCNALVGLGTGMYLEIIGPDPTQSEPEHSRPFLIDDLPQDRLVDLGIPTSRPRVPTGVPQRRGPTRPGPPNEPQQAGRQYTPLASE